MYPTNIRHKVVAAVEDGTIDKDYLFTAMLNFLSVDDVKELLSANDIHIDCESEDDDDDGEEE